MTSTSRSMQILHSFSSFSDRYSSSMDDDAPTGHNDNGSDLNQLTESTFRWLQKNTKMGMLDPNSLFYSQMHSEITKILMLTGNTI